MAPSPKADNSATPPAPAAASPVMVRPPAHAGTSRRRRSTPAPAVRHGRAGATAMRNSNESPRGMVMRSKYGSPTDSCVPRNASATSGKTVPSSTTKAKPAKSTLLARKAASRETGESMRPGARRWSPRQAMRPMPTAATIPRKARSNGPTDDCEKAWTEFTTPERARNVPRMVRQNVATRSERFQTRSIPRRSCTTTECRYAVAVSQGRNEAFSTGSHAQ